MRGSCRGNLLRVKINVIFVTATLPCTQDLGSTKGWPSPSNIINRRRLRPPCNLHSPRNDADRGRAGVDECFGHHRPLAASSTRSRDAIKKRRQCRSYISMVSNLRAAAPASPNILLSENQNPTNFSIAENQELVAAVDSLLLNDQDATLRRKNLASPERGKNALAEWANSLTGCISRVHRNTR
uniref:Uncharacterized protein n=1 Tax=Glossina austeni TaxID=7395 RepID=A0A1A9VXG6_GLOAU